MSQSVSSSFISPSTTTSTAAPESSSTGIAFRLSIGEMFTCGVSVVEWTYTGPEAPMSFNITNVDVPQQAPLISSSATKSTTENGNATPSAAKRDTTMRKRQYSGYGGTYLPQINEQIIATQLDPLMGIWRWPSTNVPQGWYQMLATVQGVLDASSSSFFVQNGTAVDCVLQFYPAPSTPTLTPAVIVPALTKTIIATQVPSTTPSSSKAISHTGAVAGGITGGAAAVILVILIIAFARRRGRRRKSIDPYSSSNAPALTPSLLHYRSRPVGMPIVPLNPGQTSLPPVPVGLSHKELARLRSTHIAEFSPASPSASDTLPTTTSSPPIVVTAGQGGVTPQADIQSEVDYLRREVQRLHAQQVRSDVFTVPPSYGEAR